MFRCASRLQLQFPQHIWRAAFANSHQPHLGDIERHCHRLNAESYTIVQWHLGETPTLTLASSWQITQPICEHPYMVQIIHQRLQEAHYTLRPSLQPNRTPCASIVVHDVHRLPGVESIEIHHLDEVLAKTSHHDVVIQPIALSQREALVADIQQCVQRHADKHIVVGKAIEYDRRLLDIIYDCAQPLAALPMRRYAH